MYSNNNSRKHKENLKRIFFKIIEDCEDINNIKIYLHNLLVKRFNDYCRLYNIKANFKITQNLINSFNIRGDLIF
jgi:hypothetical protein